jgi:hypothetical protein
MELGTLTGAAEPSSEFLFNQTPTFVIESQKQAEEVFD